VFPSWEYEDGGAGRVSSGGVCANDGVIHGAAHAFVVVLWVSDVGAVQGMWCALAAG
jgi:hypothetical protein